MAPDPVRAALGTLGAVQRSRTHGAPVPVDPSGRGGGATDPQISEIHVYEPGTEPPAGPFGPTPPVVRAFAFVDLCGFTRFVEAEGPALAVGTLARFRSLVSDVAARRGVRVTKWLGDGAMLVGVATGPLVATAVETAARTTSPLPLRGGVASGGVILFAGDDYLGSTVNVAARLCDRAAPGEVLATELAAADRPHWVDAGPLRTISLKGTPLQEVRSLTVAEGVSLR